MSSQFPLDPADSGTATRRTGRAGRIGLLALALGFGGFVLWAAFAPLDEGVAAPGSVTVDTKRKSVQHLSGGIVKDVLVHEGQQVKEGDALVRLDPAVAQANFESSRQRYFALRAMEGRLIAEQGGQSKITWHPDLKDGAQDPLIKQQLALQEQLLATRRAALQADLSAIEESIRGQEGLVQAYRGMLENRKMQFSLLSEELKNVRPLVADGYAPRTRQMELERAVAESLAAQTELQGNSVRSVQAIAELRQRATARQAEYRKEIESQRADVTREVEAESAKYASLKNDLARTEIRSPATGQVVGLSTQTLGGVVGPGQKLMDIVPSDAPLLLEARVPPHVIDRVRNGMPVDIRFSAFSHAPTLVVDGKVVSISADLIVEPQTNIAYYLARVAVTPEGLKKLGQRQMQPGMPAEVIIRTGERSLITYLVGPLVKRVAASMKEE
ncbi:HlyD family type I secretion periplasmic adaptor subunit [Ramlibacter sp. MAHUQ-53]|uniref:HlyD family type I secretion periplasmic adaptor subunit n=1 Tax=unclassified Ramlibacter TaxID=2617605 RepID=UPI00363E872F